MYLRKSLGLHVYIPFILTVQFKKEDIYFDGDLYAYLRMLL